MALALARLYPTGDEALITLYDLRNPEAVEQLHRGRAIWQEDSDIEALDEDHFVLVVRPGALVGSRLARVVPGRPLRFLLAAMLIFIGVRLLVIG